MALKLTKKQLQYLQNNDFTLFPDGSVKKIKESNRDILIIDLHKMYKTSMCTKLEYLEIVEDYEKIGWTYYCVLPPYVYFYKKHTLWQKLKSFFN